MFLIDAPTHNFQHKVAFKNLIELLKIFLQILVYNQFYENGETSKKCH